MEETIQIWLFGGIGACVIAGVAFAFGVTQRITRLETILDILGKRAAKILHSPDDHLRIDALLDKYIECHYDFPYSDWLLLIDALLVIENDINRTKDEWMLCAFVNAVVTHKLQRQH
jgi:hypothetical protein